MTVPHASASSSAAHLGPAIIAAVEYHPGAPSAAVSANVAPSPTPAALRAESNAGTNNTRDRHSASVVPGLPASVSAKTPVARPGASSDKVGDVEGGDEKHGQQSPGRGRDGPGEKTGEYAQRHRVARGHRRGEEPNVASDAVGVPQSVADLFRATTDPATPPPGSPGLGPTPTGRRRRRTRRRSKRRPLRLYLRGVRGGNPLPRRAPRVRLGSRGPRARRGTRRPGRGDGGHATAPRRSPARRNPTRTPPWRRGAARDDDARELVPPIRAWVYAGGICATTPNRLLRERPRRR